MNVLSNPVPIPTHVPPDLVFDFDYRADPAFQVDPHARLLELVERAPPIFYTPRQNGHWIITGHDLLFEAGRNPGLFSPIPPAKPGQPQLKLLPLMVPPEEHPQYRTPLNKAFGPQAMYALEGKIRERVRELIDKVKDQNGCDFVAAVGEPLPVSIFLDLIGLPIERLAEFRFAIHQMQTQRDPDGPAKALSNIGRIMEPYIQERRTNRGTDLLSVLWGQKIGDREITIEEMRNYGIFLFIAGLDTVINAMGLAVKHMAQHPELQAELRADKTKIRFAVEEMLRCYGIVAPPRHLTADTVVEGIQLLKGEEVVLMYPAGSLDPHTFPQPGKFDLDRENKSHLGFGAGPHRCVGAHLARIELNVMYEEWLAAIPHFRMDPDNPPTFHTGGILSLEQMHILW